MGAAAVQAGVVGLLGAALVWAGCAGSAGSGAAGPASASAREPAATAAEAEGEPSADQERVAAIEKAVNDTREARHECWAFAAADDFRLRGRMVLRLRFAGEDTAAVEVIEDEPGDPRLVACIEELYQAYRWPDVFEPGQSIELPLVFQAPDAQYTVAARYVEPRVLGEGEVTVAVLLDELSTGNGAAALSLLSLQRGAEVPLHRHTSAEVLYVRSGQGRVYSLDGRERGVRVGPGQGIYIPAGTAHGFVHEGKEPAVLVQLYAPAGPERRFKGGPTIGTTPVPARELQRPPRRFPRPLITKEPTVYEIAGGAASVAFYFDKDITGDDMAYMGVFRARPGAEVPAHKHAAESEILLVVQGGGVMTVAGETYPVAPMTAVQVPANTEHSFTVTSEEPVEAIQFYTPSGPEQRFKSKP